MDKEKNIVLIAFYNIKALGVRYIESALRNRGYEVTTVFLKDFNSVNPKPATDKEIAILTDVIRKTNPLFVGLSVMSSMYLDTVHAVIGAVKSTGYPMVCGGAYATMFPEHFLARGVDYVIRADGENPICALADAIMLGKNADHIPSLCYKKNDEIIINDIDGILTEIDGYGLPQINCPNAYKIENNTLSFGDPQLSTLSYEVIASRGCPFTCSYCCSINLNRLFPKGKKYVRTRSVENIIDELIIAKNTHKKLVFIRFYDEIFPNSLDWVDKFVEEYKTY